MLSETRGHQKPISWLLAHFGNYIHGHVLFKVYFETKQFATIISATVEVAQAHT